MVTAGWSARAPHSPPRTGGTASQGSSLPAPVDCGQLGSHLLCGFRTSELLFPACNTSVLLSSWKPSHGRSREGHTRNSDPNTPVQTTKAHAIQQQTHERHADTGRCSKFPAPLAVLKPEVKLPAALTLGRSSVEIKRPSTWDCTKHQGLKWLTDLFQPCLRELTGSFFISSLLKKEKNPTAKTQNFPP